MTMMKIAGTALAAAAAAVLLKQYKPEYAMAAETAGCVLILMAVIMSAAQVFEFAKSAGATAGIDSEYLSLAVKVTCIAIIARFASDICRDAGQSALAGKVEFAAKAIILAAALPLLENIVSAAQKLLGT